MSAGIRNQPLVTIVLLGKDDTPLGAAESACDVLCRSGYPWIEVLLSRDVPGFRAAANALLKGRKRIHPLSAGAAPALAEEISRLASGDLLKALRLGSPDLPDKVQDVVQASAWSSSGYLALPLSLSADERKRLILEHLQASAGSEGR